MVSAQCPGLKLITTGACNYHVAEAIKCYCHGVRELQDGVDCESAAYSDRMHELTPTGLVGGKCFDRRNDCYCDDSPSKLPPPTSRVLTHETPLVDVTAQDWVRHCH